MKDEPPRNWFEYAGYVLERGGEYFYSEPVTQGSLHRVTRGCLIYRRGDALAAVFHTHPADPRFSRSDRADANTRAVPAYLGTYRDGLVLRYDPETGETSDVGTIDASDLEAMRFVREE
jgi:hypothetical protein